MSLDLLAGLFATQFGLWWIILPAMLLGMAAALWAMGVRRPGVLAGLSVAVAAAAYLLFIAALNSSFPHGPIEHLIAGLVRR